MISIERENGIERGVYDMGGRILDLDGSCRSGFGPGDEDGPVMSWLQILLFPHVQYYSCETTWNIKKSKGC
jgi:hypothetical protein